MTQVDKSLVSVRFGPFELLLDTQELRKNGVPVKLFGQPIQVLIVLCARPGRLVTREELQQKLWPGDSFGDFEHGLNAAVNKLREKLGDSATTPYSGPEREILKEDFHSRRSGRRLCKSCECNC